jgi:hypothetical protein
VRVRDGDLLITDGPFAETEEQFGGCDVIECADLDEAIEGASKHPVAKFGTIEVRPFWQWRFAADHDAPDLRLVVAARHCLDCATCSRCTRPGRW